MRSHYRVLDNVTVVLVYEYGLPRLVIPVTVPHIVLVPTLFDNATATLRLVRIGLLIWCTRPRKREVITARPI